MQRKQAVRIMFLMKGSDTPHDGESAVMMLTPLSVALAAAFAFALGLPAFEPACENMSVRFEAQCAETGSLRRLRAIAIDNPAVRCYVPAFFVVGAMSSVVVILACRRVDWSSDGFEMCKIDGVSNSVCASRVLTQLGALWTFAPRPNLNASG
jgi:hypothetical protein